MHSKGAPSGREEARGNVQRAALACFRHRPVRPAPDARTSELTTSIVCMYKCRKTDGKWALRIQSEQDADGINGRGRRLRYIREAARMHLWG